MSNTLLSIYMDLYDLQGATIDRVVKLGGGGFILITSKGTLSAIGVSSTHLEPKRLPATIPAPSFNQS